MAGKFSLEELSKDEQYLTSDGSITHIDNEFIYILKQEQGLKQEIEILKRCTLQLVKKINLKEQNFAALDSNSQYIAIVYRKGIVEIWDKLSWKLHQKFDYSTNGVYLVINEELLLVSIYAQQSPLYAYDKNTKNWRLLGYPQIHATPFLSAYYHDGLLYTGGMYEEIFATSLKLDGFKKIGFTEPWGRYVICLKVDEDNIYYGAEGIIGVYNKITKETVCEPFEDHQDNHFDIDDKYVYYSRGNNIAIKEKNSWNLIKEINSETQIRAVFVDNEFIYFNDGEIKFHQIPKTSLLIKK